MRKSLWLVALGLVFSLAGCAGQAKADTVKPLAHTTALPTSGVVTKAEMATMAKGHYRFTGKTSDFTYTWDYDAAQVKNPATQKLALRPVTTGTAQALKAAAGQEVVGLSLAKFSLAGSPKLTITVPKRWASDQVVLVQQDAGKLRRIDQQVSLQEAAAKTQLTLHVTNRNLNTKLYLVGISAKASASTAKAAKAVKTAPKTAAKQAVTAQAPAKQASANQDDTKAAAGRTADSQAAEAAAPAAASQASQSDSVSRPVPATTAAAQPQASAPAAAQTVTLSISAATAAAHLDQIAANKRQFVPSNGWILASTKVTLQSGDTAYSLLARLTKQRGIQLASRYTPAYGSYYVTGIHNLYEFDGGSASGWTYSVDGWFPNYGASEYSSLKPGSVINWVYTLELGQDVGAGSW